MVGRTVERALLAAAAAGAAVGEPRAVMLHGEPGVGKTRLVTDTADALAATHEVLWARFPRFSSDATAFLPVAQALSRWLASVSESTRATVLAGAGDLSAVLPDLGPSKPVDGGRLTVLLTTVIHRIGAVRPVVLVADDLQWADSSSLDLLAYLIAGFGPHQPLTILATYRDTELGAGHRFPEWIGDMRRMPRVTVRPVGRLGRAETADLIHYLTQKVPGGHGRPDPDALYDRSLGNPYLTELLVADPTTERGSEGGSIEDALLASWHRLGPAARTVTQILAIGGRPVPMDVLVNLARARGLSSGESVPGVASAQAAGLVVRDGDAAWFRHPLLAEVISDTVPPAAARSLHEHYVQAIEEATGLLAHVRSALLALHYQAAGHPTAAFTWSLAAAADAATVHATAEESGHLQRACRLWDAVEEEARSATGDRVALLERACRAALRAGQFSAAHALAQETIRTAVEFDDPVSAARLIYTFRFVDPQQGRRAGLERAVTAHELAEQGGPSEVLALTLSYRSDAELWGGVPGAENRACAAIAMAEQVGSPVALAHAHLVHSQFNWSNPEGAQEATAAWTALRKHGELLDWGTNNVKVMNCLEGIGRYDALVDHGMRVLADLQEAGAPALGGPPGAITAHFLFRLGRWEEARRVIRANLTHQQMPNFGSSTRATAAQLSAQEGDLDAARDHLVRAHELMGTRDPLGSHASLAQVEVQWSGGDLAGARDSALADIPQVAAMDPDHADELSLWCLRSIADLAEARRPPDRGGTPALADLQHLDQARAVPVAEPVPRLSDDSLHQAIAALITAERARCTASADQVPLWRAARDAADGANLLWEAGWAGYQLGRTMLGQHGQRPEAADILRTAHQAMTQLGAQPLADRIHSIAVQAHIHLDEPAPLEAGNHGTPPAWEPDGLTRREREVLALVVTGRTYADIARALFISEKTVSVHISNLLRKTGTSSRIDLAAHIAAQRGPGPPEAQPAGPRRL